MKNNKKRKKRNLKKIIQAIASIIVGLTSWGLYFLDYGIMSSIFKKFSITDMIFVWISVALIFIGVSKLCYELFLVNLFIDE